MIIKIFFGISLILITLCNATSKNDDQMNSTDSPKKPVTQDVDYWDNDDFVPFQSNRHDEFDWKLTKAVLLEENKNIMFSSFSVKLLLSLLAEAAGPDTSTHKELSSILPSIESIHQARDLYGKIFGSLQKKSDDYDLKLATKIYVDNFITPRQRYAAILESFYFTKIERIDFHSPTEAANIINDWCANVTNNNIKNFVQKDDIENAVIILLNGIYFNGYWRQPFSVNETVELPFFVKPTEHIRTEYMMQTAKFYYVESAQLDAKILRLPYKGRKFSMTIILPNSKGGVDELIRQMESNSLHRAQWLMDEVEVRVALPKFKFDYTSHLNRVLENLGISQIFTTDASLPALAHGRYVENQLVVSQVLQKAGIDVNEKGSTVYAATEVVLTNKFGGDDTREFIVNRPCIFLIEDETTGTLLFSGKLVNPTYV